MMSSCRKKFHAAVFIFLYFKFYHLFWLQLYWHFLTPQMQYTVLNCSTIFVVHKKKLAKVHYDTESVFSCPYMYFQPRSQLGLEMKLYGPLTKKYSILCKIKTIFLNSPVSFMFLQLWKLRNWQCTSWITEVRIIKIEKSV